jgi:hypothetical protein
MFRLAPAWLPTPPTVVRQGSAGFRWFPPDPVTPAASPLPNPRFFRHATATPSPSFLPRLPPLQGAASSARPVDSLAPVILAPRSSVSVCLTVSLSHYHISLSHYIRVSLSLLAQTPSPSFRLSRLSPSLSFSLPHSLPQPAPAKSPTPTRSSIFALSSLLLLLLLPLQVRWLLRNLAASSLPSRAHLSLSPPPTFIAQSTRLHLVSLTSFPSVSTLHAVLCA